MTSPHQPGRIQLRNTVTGSVRFVRFGSPEHHALKAERHPDIWTRPLWAQIDTPTNESQEDA